mmetsp:Transcript_20602/g.26697  ORF Transcript_20602/g.26697 Transcript_20602/m.26697 type:complete len:284 (+) Transcript_20602:43-894(+)
MLRSLIEKSIQHDAFRRTFAINPVLGRALSAETTLLPNQIYRRNFVSESKSKLKPPKPSPQQNESQDNSLRGPVTFASLGLMALAGLTLGYYYNTEKQRKKEQAVSQVRSVGKPALGGSWTLVDENGIPRTDLDFRGQWVLLYFGFTRCPDICPSELVKIGKIIEELDKVLEVEVKPVFISVDPDRDSVGQLKAYAQDFHPRFTYLTGTKDQVFKAAKAYRVYFSKADEHDLNDDEYLVDHSIVIYLNGPDGKFVDFFTQSTKVTDCIQKTVKHVQQFEASSN